MKYLVILCLCSTFLFSQVKSIKGKIIDNETGKPLASASVTLDNTNRGAMSDAKGEFIFTDVSQNKSFTVSHIGYNQVTKTISEINDDSSILIRLVPKIISSQTVLITGTIGTQGSTPLTFSQVKKGEIKENYVYQDIPEYLSSLPSTNFYSESGNGLGYNYLSIRGFDQRRISVAINGIPQNDPEDHNVYWLDFPDLLASTELIQVQRGSGSGLIGYPSIGGSINLITSSIEEAGANLSINYGSYNSRKYSASFASGIINNQYSIFAKLSKIMSSGYREKSWVNFNSYHVSATRFDKDFTTQINLYGGPVSDGLAYTGLPKFAVKDRIERKKNYSYWEADDKSYSYALHRRSDELENFSQPHFEILNEYNISNDISLNSALFLVLGTGFFDYDGSWVNYLDNDPIIADSLAKEYFRITPQNGFNKNASIPTNALIRAQVENKQYGWIPRISFKHNDGELIAGAEIRIHRSLHWGSINHAENIPAGVTKEYRYYQYRGAKDILNFFLHEDYKLSDDLNLLAELQFAYHKYKLYEEKYLGNDFQVKGFFVNPKAAINYKLNENQSMYFSFAKMSREPRLKNHYDAAESSYGEQPQFLRNNDGTYNFDEPLVKPETMNDFELGTSYNTTCLSLNANLFYMLFSDEIVKSGQVDRFGQPITGNVDQTIHSGIELTIKANLFNYFQVILNGTYSRNYVDNGNTYITYEDPITENDVTAAIDLSGNKISGFPDLMFNGIIRFKYEGLLASLSIRYSGKFYSDNYDDKLSSYLLSYPGFTDYADNVVDSYFTADLFTSYELNLNTYFNSIRIFGQVNNIFDNLYAAYAIGKEFFPAAERNFTVGMQVGF